jgi:hypothetical protein
MSASIQDMNMDLGDAKGLSKLTNGRPQSHAFGILVSANIAAHSSSKFSGTDIQAFYVDLINPRYGIKAGSHRSDEASWLKLMERYIILARSSRY